MRDADMPDDLLANLLTGAHRLDDLDAGALAFGIMFGADEHVRECSRTSRNRNPQLPLGALLYPPGSQGLKLNKKTPHKPTKPTNSGNDDPEIWGGGINLGWNGFTIGGSYAEQDGTTASDGRSYDVGIGYSNGPWGYSLTYFNGENIDDENVATNSREEIDIIIAAATYTVNKNFKLSAFIADVDFTEERNDAGVANGSDDVSGTVVGLGAKFTF